MVKRIWLAVAMLSLLPLIAQADPITLGKLQKMTSDFDSLGGQDREKMYRPLLMYFAGLRDAYNTGLMDALVRLKFTGDEVLARRATKCSNIDANLLMAHALSELRSKTATPDVSVAIWTRLYMNEQCADVLADIENAEVQD